jgi:hypothetical protein
MSFLDATLEALRGFASEVGTWTNQGSLVSIEQHIAQIENAAAEDLHAGETAAKAVWADLYTAFHGHATTPAAPVTGGPVAGSTVLVGESGPELAVPPTEAAPVAPVAADPTSAPSTTTEASSAPSSTPSDSTTETAQAEAPEAPSAQ